MLLLSLSAAAGFFAAQWFPDGLPVLEPVDSSSPQAKPAVLSLDHDKLTLYASAGASLKLSGGTGNVSWSSGNEAVAKVDQKGNITGVTAGKTVITASSGGKKAECAVTVLALPELTVKNPAGCPVDEKQLQTLRDLMAKHPLNVSVYYRDLSGGCTIEYNSGKKYQAGSVVKAPYCKWLIACGADLQEKLTLRQEDILEGAGTVKKQPVGTEFTVEELIRSAIVDSDNTAYHILTKRFGFEGYLQYMKSLGVSANQNAENLFGNLSAAGAGICFTDIYSWSGANPEQSKLLMDSLCGTSYRKLISSVTDVPVAHKYGYNNGTNGFHDAAIVYSDHPYVLTIFTTLDPDQKDTVPYIQSVASCLNSINGAQQQK